MLTLLGVCKVGWCITPLMRRRNPTQRNEALYRETILAVNYEMGEKSRAEKIQLKFFLKVNRLELVSLEELLGNQAELSMVVR